MTEGAIFIQYKETDNPKGKEKKESLRTPPRSVLSTTVTTVTKGLQKKMSK